MNAVKTLILGLCIAGATAAFATSHIGSVPMNSGHQAIVAAMPIPRCSPGANCGGNGGTGFLAAMPIPRCSPGANCGGNGGTGFLAAMPIPRCSPGANCGGNGGTGFLA
jgi:hypothetical protein